MIYACEDCGFLFRRTIEVTECPFCEKTHIRLATDEEAGRLLELLEQETAKQLMEKHTHSR